MNEQEKQNSLLAIDNAKFHVSKKVQEYLKTKNVKIITNVPYLSIFNSIELTFKDF